MDPKSVSSLFYFLQTSRASLACFSSQGGRLNKVAMISRSSDLDKYILHQTQIHSQPQKVRTSQKSPSHQPASCGALVTDINIATLAWSSGHSNSLQTPCQSLSCNFSITVDFHSDKEEPGLDCPLFLHAHTEQSGVNR
jgi:hypothetical protein